MKLSDVKTEAFRTILGLAPGEVIVYSSDYDSVDKKYFQIYNSIKEAESRHGGEINDCRRWGSR